jgi:hypothetical protein
MDGIQPGSLSFMVAACPVISLSVDGLTAKGRFNGLRFQGDGQGNTRIQGGVYENEYVLSESGWKISLLKYWPLYAGPYIGGWRNVDGPKGYIPYHFTPDSAGVPIPPAIGNPPVTRASERELGHRISRMNHEDEVRNLQDAYGFYVDRRMWTDVVDLFASEATVKIDGVGTYSGTTGVRQALEDRWGAEGLSTGILNDHPIFDTIVKIDDSGLEAIARGIEIGMIGDANKQAGSWEFNVFRNRFIKEGGLWKLKELHITPLIVANYTSGWGHGGIAPANAHIPDFLDAERRAAVSSVDRRNANFTNLKDLERYLSRSAAYDGVENISSAYGYYADDIGCHNFATLHARNGHKESPFAGFYRTPERIDEACRQVYGTNRSSLRSSISFHWRPQPVILVSEDGRSATSRTRLLQPSTSTTKAGSFNGAIYHDQMVLENGIWKLWTITIDEFYMRSDDWAGGWATVKQRDPNATNPGPSSWTLKYPPDVTLADLGVRDEGFRGGNGRFVDWPEIQTMWFAYRNPVSGRVPDKYWPGCVPCKFKPEWSLTANGYQEPSTGPGPEPAR